MDVDWDAWKPGGHAAAAAIAGPRLRQLLDAAAIELPVAARQLGEVAAVLGASLASAALAGPVTYSVQSLAAQLATMLDDPAGATAVAGTLMTLARSAAAIAAYRESGVAYVGWSSARDSRVCARCRANSAAGPVPVGQAFPSGGVMPPGCPGCRCALLSATP